MTANVFGTYGSRPRRRRHRRTSIRISTQTQPRADRVLSQDHPLIGLMKFPAVVTERELAKLSWRHKAETCFAAVRQLYAELRSRPTSIKRVVLDPDSASLMTENAKLKAEIAELEAALDDWEANDIKTRKILETYRRVCGIKLEH